MLIQIDTTIKTFIIFTVVALLTACQRDGPLLTDIPVEEISNELESSIPALMKKRNVAGLSVVVIRNGKPSISKSFGYADIQNGRKVDEQTVFRAASLGKPIFAYIVVLLAQQGRIELDTPLFSYLDEEIVKDDPRSKTITARMVLSHTSGLPNLSAKIAPAELLFDPGTGFEYSGHGYLYLQKVIESVTDKSLDELASELVFQPLGMTQSSFRWQDKYRDKLPLSYDNAGNAFPAKENPATGFSAWSLFTTIDDFARFASFMIETSAKPGSVAETMLKPQVDVATKVKWGMGWGLQDSTPNPSFWHWGSMAGFRHYVVGYPTEQTAVIVLTNSWRAFKMVDDVIAMAIGGSYPSYDWF